MNFDRLNRWLTLGANVGVIVGLALLTMEVRQARQTAEAEMYNNFAEGSVTLNSYVISDAHFARVFVLGLYEPERLTDPEAIQFAMFMRAYVNHYLRQRQLYRLGLLDDQTWSFNVQQLAGVLSMPGGKLFAESNKEELDPSLLDEIAPYLGQEPKFDLMLGRKPSEMQ